MLPIASTSSLSRPAGLTMPGGYPTDAILRALTTEIRHASHLSPADAIEVESLARTLVEHGHVHVDETMAQRFNAVAGVQWAMEKVLIGIEFIVTPERATPLRTHADADRAMGQVIREAVLRERMERGDPLHLVFCADGTGTAEQDAAYRRNILGRYGWPASSPPMLSEHLLRFPKDMFAWDRSGAFILATQEGRTVGFAIRAAQAGNTANARTLELFLGDIDCNRAPGPAWDDARVPASPATAADMIGAWAVFLDRYAGIDCFGIARETGHASGGHGW